MCVCVCVCVCVCSRACVRAWACAGMRGCTDVAVGVKGQDENSHHYTCTYYIIGSNNACDTVYFTAPLYK